MNAETAQEEKKETPTEEVKENSTEKPKAENEAKTEDEKKDKVAKQGSAAVNNLRVLENIEVRLTVEVGNTEIKIKDLLDVIRDKNNIISDELHKTLPILTKYEKTRIRILGYLKITDYYLNQLFFFRYFK